MRKIKDVLRLKLDAKLSHQQIATLDGLRVLDRHFQHDAAHGGRDQRDFNHRIGIVRRDIGAYISITVDSPVISIEPNQTNIDTLPV